MPLDEYLKLLDWTARRRADGKRGFTPEEAPPILQRLRLSADTWCELVENFGRLFHNVAGCPAVVDLPQLLRHDGHLSPQGRTVSQLLEVSCRQPRPPPHSASPG